MKAVLKNAFREIRRKHRQFISLVVLVALGVGFFVGIRTTGVYMRLTGDDYFDRLHLMDMNIISTMGLTQTDVALLESVQEGVHAYGSKNAESWLIFGAYEAPVGVYSYNDAQPVNDFVYVKGRGIENENECVIDEVLSTQYAIDLGDEIQLRTKDKDTLEKDIYTVVGIVNSPMFITFERGSSSLGSGKSEGFVYVDESMFTWDYYTNIYILSESMGALDCFTEEYSEAYDALYDAVDGISLTARQERLETLQAEAMEEIDKNQKKLDKEKASAYAELNSAKKQLDSNRKKLSSSEKQLKNGIDDLYAAMSMTNPYKGSDLVKNAKTLQKNAQGYITQQQQQFDLLYEQLEQFKQLYPDLQEEYNAQKKALDDGYAQFSVFQTQVGSMEKNARQIVEGQKELESGYASYEQNRKKADASFADAQKEIDEAIEDVEAMELPDWYILSRDSNPDYSGFYQNTNRISKVGEVFPLIFFLVAALVALTNLSRMVDESRTEIGTLKALGYRKSRILIKFLLFAFCSSVLGVVLGALVGYGFLPEFIYDAYRIMYTMQDIINPVQWEYLIFPASLSILGMMAVAYFSVSKSLRLVAAELMRPKSPPAGKRVFLEKVRLIWSRLSFMHKITVRNLFRNKGRFLMSVFGVAGCMAILITGVGLDSAIAKIGVKQYSDIFQLSVQVSIDQNIEDDDLQQVQKDIAAFPYTDAIHHAYELSVEAIAEKSSVDVYLFVPLDDEFSNFVHLQERKGKNPITIQEGEIVLDEKAAEMLDVNVGDEVTLYNRDEGIDKTFKISGITENYIMHYVYMSSTTFAEAFGEEPDVNMFYVRFTEDSQEVEDAFTNDLKDETGIANIFFSSDVDGIVGGNFNSVILVVVVSAAALAFIVLYNLNSMNINERQREIATLKVLGFTGREAASYIFRENIIFTFFGILLGFWFGKYLHGFIIKTVEIEMVMFVRDLPLYVYGVAAAMTVAFVLIVNFVMYFVIRKINMVEALKSVE